MYLKHFSTVNNYNVAFIEHSKAFVTTSKLSNKTEPSNQDATLSGFILGCSSLTIPWVMSCSWWQTKPDVPFKLWSTKGTNCLSTRSQVASSTSTDRIRKGRFFAKRFIALKTKQVRSNCLLSIRWKSWCYLQLKLGLRIELKSWKGNKLLVWSVHERTMLKLMLLWFLSTTEQADLIQMCNTFLMG